MQKPTPPVAPKPKLVLPQRPGLSANVDQTEKMQYKGKAEANRTPCPKAPSCLNNNRQEMDSTTSHVTNTNPEQNDQKRGSNNNYLIYNQPLQEMHTIGKSPHTNTDTSSPRPPVSHIAWSDEAKGNIIPLSAQEDPCRSTQTSCVPKPVPASSRKPVSLPQKPRKAVVSYMEKVEERKEINQRGTKVNVKEVKISPEETNNSSLSVSVSVPVINRPVSQSKHPFFTSKKSWVQVMWIEGQMPDSARHDTKMCPNGGKNRPQNIKEYVKNEHRFSYQPMGINEKLDRDKTGTWVEESVYETSLPLGSRASMYSAEELYEPMDRDTGHLLKHGGRASMHVAEELYEPVDRGTGHLLKHGGRASMHVAEELYEPMDRGTGHLLKHGGDKRGTVDEYEDLLDTEPFVDYDFDDDSFDDDSFDDDSFDDDSFDEDYNQSSTSSKGDPEQREMLTQRRLKNRLRQIATEIMTSERVFVDVLKLLHIDFRDVVCKASHQSGKPVIEERLLNQILHYLPQLYELNQDLLTELEHRVDRWEANAQVADIFLRKGHYLKMHSTYIRELDSNLVLLDEQSKKNAAFGAAVREFEASPRCGNVSLKQYLMKPVQRICQYQLLLTNYLKNLPADSKDYNDTEAALGIVKEVASHANDIMKHGDNFQKLIQVQCSLTGQHEILKPSRIFLKEGMLKKLSRKIMQPRMFFLFSDVLLYATPLQLGQYKFNNMLSLAGMKVSKPNQETDRNELNIESIERSFIVSASSAEERDDWLQAISTAISDYTRKETSFISGDLPQELEMDNTGTPLGSKAPIWIPDARATMCMICTCEFTLTWRRHHCRACGKVVCHSCSSNKLHLEYLKNQRARVCDQCVIILLQQKSKQAQSADISSMSTFPFIRKQKKIPAILKEVSANTDNSSMSGYLQMSKSSKNQGKRLWFVIKAKVLYTYAASEDLVALESQPLLGFMLEEDLSQKLHFKIYHKNILYYIFKADDMETAKRWIDSFKEAMVM